MQTENKPYLIEEQGWTVRVQPPKEEALASLSPRTLLLLHGWTGDETVMWIFTRNFPGNYWIFAPRAPLKADIGGYAWLPHNGDWPALTDFREVVGELLEAVNSWSRKTGAPIEKFDVMGFSQGAAMSYALAAYYPGRIDRVLALAGFLPSRKDVGPDYQTLHGKKIYIAHGTKDNIVPVQKAEEAVQVLQSAGADVTFCESDAGHKLSVSCLRGVESFLK